MSDYNTGNPVPSIDPRDLDDNATNFDYLMLSDESYVLDRLGIPRKTWSQMERDVAALVAPNLLAFAALNGAADRLSYFTGSGVLALANFTGFARTLLDDTDAPSALTTLGAAPLASPTFTGTPSAPTPAVGTNSTRVATTALIQAEIANKRAWTSWTPTITALAGSFTTVSANGSFVVIMGICHFRANLTFTARGTGTFPFMSLPVNALAGSASWLFQARENAVSGAIGYGFIDGTLDKVYISGASGATLVSADGASISINGSYPVA